MTGGADRLEVLPDEAARRRIERDLDTNFLVEAGAGAGKTTALTGRMVALVEYDRAPVEGIAAITFTRKAAAELRERFQDALERRLRKLREGGAKPAGDDAERIDRLDRALGDIDRCVIGTIHSFCARLLRERPLEVGLDPAFEELREPEAVEAKTEFWQRHLAELAERGDEALRTLERLDLPPTRLFELFSELCEHPDVDFPAPPVDPPDPAPAREALRALLERAERLMPREQPEVGWGRLQRAVRLAWFHRRQGWEETGRFFRALDALAGASLRATQNRWSDDRERKKQVKRLEEDFEAFVADGGSARQALNDWYAYRYPPALALCRRAADAFARERRRRGRLTFQDLLALAAELLRENPVARRELADRYHRLLVDEFQDTDPLQAEVVFLLAAADTAEADWRRAVPRPGSLFVVGDPKQSIYRFRRADIAVYQSVRRRFEELREDGGAEAADVLQLTTNFRSLEPIDVLVNRVFAGRFPEEGNERQAAFAPLITNRKDGDSPRRGVFVYRLEDPAAKSKEGIAAWEAQRLASWIQRRIESGEREPGDFLVLAGRKGQLHQYGRELEARGVAVQVTGSPLLLEHELRELMLLLRCLADPGDPVLCEAVLEGLFFGFDHETMVRHVLAGGDLRFVGGPDPGAGAEDVRDALRSLGEWWEWARAHPVDVFLSELVDALGLLPFAAAGELGATRGGVLSYVLQCAERATATGGGTLRAAVNALRELLEVDEAEPSLFPGREDVVRVMNLHQAKGTEARVVVLAHPTGLPSPSVTRHVLRGEGGAAEGFLSVVDRVSTGKVRVLARPLDWEEHRRREEAFEAAERDRLVYVAATRAMDELIVALCPPTEAKSYWQPLYPVLEEMEREGLATDITTELEEVTGRSRPALERSAPEIEEDVRAAAEARERAAAPTHVAETVTEQAKTEAYTATLGVGGAGRGVEWGSAVHEALEAAGDGTAGPELRALARAALLAHDRPSGADGQPRELEELLALVARVRGSELWRRAEAAARALHEIAFALPEAAPPGVGGPLRITEGKIDLAFREAAGWVLVDYKTDRLEDPAVREARLAAYRAQVDRYAECWSRLTGEPVDERVLLFVATGEEVSW